MAWNQRRKERSFSSLFGDSSQETNSDDDSPKGHTEQEELFTAAVTSRKSAQKPLSPEDVQQETFFERIRDGHKNVQSISKSWIRRYTSNQNTAMAELLTVILQGAGVHYPVSPDLCQPPPSATKTLRSFLQSIHDVDAKYFKEEPFKVKRGLKACRANYTLFWRELMKELMTSSPQPYDHFIECIMATLTSLATSRIRSLRYVACFVTASISYEWITALDEKMSGRASVEHQFQAAQRSRGTSGRVRELKLTMERYHSQVTQLQSNLRSLFEAVLSERFRDVCENVRAISTEAIGEWCVLLPSEYLNDHYLRYIAWALCDRAADVRSAALATLLKLYKKEDQLIRLREFTQRFQSRMCEMVYDVDDGVAALSAKLLTCLVSKDLIPVTAIKHVYCILTDASSSMRQAIADLVSELLKSNAKQRVVSLSVSSSENEIIFNGLVNVLCNLAIIQSGGEIEGDDACWMEDCMSENHFSLSTEFVMDLLRPLYNKLEVLKNWDVLLKVLNEEIDKGDVAESRLNIVVQCVDFCARFISESKPRGRQKKDDTEEKLKQEMTSKVIDYMSQWLNEFHIDALKMRSFVGMIRTLHLELYVLKSSKDAFAEVIENVAEVLFKHHDHGVLRECTQTLIHAATHGPEELKCIGRDCLKLTGRKIMEHIRGLTGRLDLMLDSEAGRNELTAWQATAERIKYFLAMESPCEMFPRDELEQLIAALITRCQGSRELADTVGVSSCQCMFLLILRTLAERRGDAEEGVSDYQSQMCNLLRRILEQSVHEDVRRDARSLLVDVYLIFGRGKQIPAEIRFYNWDWLFSAVLESMCPRLALFAQEGVDTESTRQLSDEAITMGKLVLYADVKHEAMRELGAEFMSLLTSPLASVVEVVRGVVRCLQKSDHHRLADYFLLAMMKRFESRDENCQTFVEYVQKVSSCYLVFNNPNVRGFVHRIVSAGIDLATATPPFKTRFLTEGISCFTSKLTGKSCEKIKEKMKRLQDTCKWTAEEQKEIEPYLLSLAVDFNQTKGDSKGRCRVGEGTQTEDNSRDGRARDGRGHFCKRSKRETVGNEISHSATNLA